MKASELRIGNYALHNNGNVYPITKSNIGSFNPDLWDSIPLTEKWLTKFGFENLMRKSKKGYKASGYSYKGNFSLCVYFDDGRLSVDFWQGNEKKYVHELQNFFFALTGEELTINEPTKEPQKTT